MTRRDLLLFIHGLGGTAEGTWGRFPELVRADPDLGQAFEIGFFEYPTSLWGRWFGSLPSIQSLSDALDSEIRHRRGDCEGVFLVCHSLGGLVARRWMARQFRAERRARAEFLLKGAIFYATPHRGAEIARIPAVLPLGNRQARQLCEDSDLVSLLNEAWLDDGLQNHYRTKYVVGLLDQVVEESSGRPHWAGDYEAVAGCDHRSIVKPESAEALSFRILKRFLLEKPEASGALTLTREADALRLAQRPIRARQVYEEALVEARKARDPADEAYAYRGLGHLEAASGRYAQAQRAYRQALELYAALPEEPVECGFVLRGLADLNAKQGQYDEARRYFQRARSVFSGHRHLKGLRNVLVGLGHLEANLGNFEAACRAYEGVLAIKDDGDGEEPRRAHAHAHRGLGDLACAYRRRELAEEEYGKAMAHYVALNDATGRANVLEGRGRLALAFGEPEQAARCFSEALELYQAADDLLGESLIHLDLGELRLAQGLLPEARRELRAAQIGYETLGDPQGEAHVFLQQGCLERAEARPEEARRAFHHAQIKFDLLADRVGAAKLALEAGRLEAEAGNATAARGRFERALATFKEIDDKASQAEARLGLARALLGVDPDKAAQLAKQALANFTKLGLAAEAAEAESLAAEIRAGTA